MNARSISKTILKVLVKGGTSAAAANLVSAHRSVSENGLVDFYYKSSSLVAGAATGWMIGDLVAEFAGEKFDELFSVVEQKIQEN